MNNHAVLRFRLNCLDYYQATATELDPQLFELKWPSKQTNKPQVPIIRAFGSTENGQKVCAHIHGILPYLYLEYQGSTKKRDVDEYITALRVSIDHALAISYRRGVNREDVRYVGHISPVKGIPFYGYNVGYKLFLKIYLLNPLHTNRLADLLHQGAVLKRPFQPYEAHLQYLLQWMCDYNLYGCAYIDCARVMFRSPLPDHSLTRSSQDRWHDRGIHPSWILDSDRFPRQSHCSIEIDVCAEYILNRRDIQPRPMHHDFFERFNHSGTDQKFVQSMAGLWRDETIRRKKRMGLSNPSSSPFPPDVLVSMSADPRASQKGGWIHEDEYWEMIEGLIRDEQSKAWTNGRKSFEQFVQPSAGEECIKTALESIEDLYAANLSALQSVETDSLDTYSSVLEADTLTDMLQAAETQVDDSCNSDDERCHTIDIDESAGNIREVGSMIQAPADQVNGIPSMDKPPDGNISPRLTSVKKRNISEIWGSGDQGGTLNVSPSKRVNLGVVDNPIQSKAGKSSKTIVGPISQSFSQSSQTSIKAHGSGKPNTLSFPTVKNPHDPGTKLRLSQSQFSNVQMFPNTSTTINYASPDSKRSTETSWKENRSTLTGGSQGESHIEPEVIRRAKSLRRTFISSTRQMICLSRLAPSKHEISSTMLHYALSPVVYQDAFYSNEKDIPERPRDYAGRVFKLESNTLPYLSPFDPTAASLATLGAKSATTSDVARREKLKSQFNKQYTLMHWQISSLPPTRMEVKRWSSQDSRCAQQNTMRSTHIATTSKASTKTTNISDLSQIDGPTQKNKHGFKFSQNHQSTSVQHETQYMSIMSLEVHVNTRDNLAPDPAHDEIGCIFWCIESDSSNTNKPRLGMLAMSGDVAPSFARQVNVPVEYEDDELDLLNKIVDIVRYHDPDILTGYEVHNGSWGYLIGRAKEKYEFDLCDELSRVKSQSHSKFGKDDDSWGFTHTSTIHITGRHTINIWRAMRSELNLLQYTMENVVFHLLHKRIPHYTFADLTRWYKSGKPHDFAKTIDYFLNRTRMNLSILEANELISRTSEQARLLGVDFFSVFSRGSQYKVESLMFRIAKAENFILISPSRKQVGQQNALECLPLVMEPQSAFYNSPLLVLDFQSLYPSVMIAYNYCYSTCLGRVAEWRGQNKLGFTDFKRQPGLLELVQNYINIAPNGMMYVKPEMRKSLLAKMLGEILETRVMVKSGMKADKDDKTLQKLLNNRQLALKLIANVTYGYTSASFSGRMPCSEIADSIVQTGRETLEKAIALIHSVKRWGAEVVYGDTDSLFVYLRGRTKDEAFIIGDEIAKAVTNTNPRPIKLKFEKVYFPCVLLAKKRYVGFKYESPGQQEPEFDAKGIEIVRRDGTPVEQKIEEKALKLMFRTADLSQVKTYFQRECTKILSGKVSTQDFLFAREVKLGTYSDRGPPPPGALIATKRMMADPRTEPQYGERVPYVVATGAPGGRLIDRCVAPETLLQDEQMELDAEYYISKNIIPPLERIFSLVGANVRQWYDEMPKVQKVRPITTVSKPLNSTDQDGIALQKRKTLESYLKASACLICKDKLPPPSADDGSEESEKLPLCDVCLSRPAAAVAALRGRLRKVELKVQNVETVCRSCASLAFGEEVRCDSRDCPVFYTRVKENANWSHCQGGESVVLEALEARAWEDGQQRAIEW